MNDADPCLRITSTAGNYTARLFRTGNLLIRVYDMRNTKQALQERPTYRRMALRGPQYYIQRQDEV